MTQPLRTLTPSQAAVLLSCHVKTVLKWIHEGKLPARLLGKRWKILERDLEAFLQRGRAG